MQMGEVLVDQRSDVTLLPPRYKEFRDTGSMLLWHLPRVINWLPIEGA
jgi:hypothetical protein